MRRLLMLAVGLALFALPTAGQAANLSSAGAYLAGSLDRNGCAREQGGPASANLSAWVAFGLVSAGRSASGPAD